jgi:predicted acylesterase/phospholipase RssA
VVSRNSVQCILAAWRHGRRPAEREQIRKMSISKAFESSRRDAPLVLSNQEEGVLVLQGGGALGAYQAGVFEALYRSGIKLDWVAGISIGAINAALIAGNPPERRVSRLKEFWHLVSSAWPALRWCNNGAVRSWLNEASAALVMLFGVPGFFTPRLPQCRSATPPCRRGRRSRRGACDAGCRRVSGPAMGRGPR